MDLEFPDSVLSTDLEVSRLGVSIDLEFLSTWSFSELEFQIAS